MNERNFERKAIHMDLWKLLRFHCADKWYKQKPEYVLQIQTRKIL